MYICVYICIYIYIYTYTYTYIYIYVHIYIYIYVCMCRHLFICVVSFFKTYKQICMCMYTYIHTYPHLFICQGIYSYVDLPAYLSFLLLYLLKIYCISNHVLVRCHVFIRWLVCYLTLVILVTVCFPLTRESPSALLWRKGCEYRSAMTRRQLVALTFMLCPSVA